MKELVKENSEEEKMKKQEETKAEKEEKKFEQTKGKAKKVKKTVENMSENQKKKKVIPIILITIVVILGIFCSTIFALVNINNEKIISGISIQGIDVSGLSKEEANAKMQEIYQEKKAKEIGIKYEDYESTLNPELMEVNYEVEKAVEEAYLIGKGENIFVNNYNILFTLIGKKDIPVNMTLNEEVGKQTIEDIGVNIPGLIIESSYAVEEDELIITKGKAGVIVNTTELLNKVKEKLNDINYKEDYITIPVEQKEPKLSTR